MPPDVPPLSGPGPDELARALVVLGNETRLRVLHRLAEPAFVPDLAKELGVTRQAVARHLEELIAVGLVEAQRSRRRGAMPATRYAVSASGLFAFKESVLALALRPAPPPETPAPTRLADHARAPVSTRGVGLLLVHGDAPGRWFGLASGASWILGRDAKAEICLAYDPYVSARHAHLERTEGRWAVTDLHSTNGTLVNFEPLAAGEKRGLVPGDLLTVGKSRLVLRGP